MTRRLQGRTVRPEGAGGTAGSERARGDPEKSMRRKSKNWTSPVDFNKIARMASGASGAELANIINEAALRAVRENRSFVTEADLEESIEVVIAGYQKKNAILTDKEKRVVAYHEIGHALVAAKQNNSASGPEDHHRSAYFRSAGVHDAGGGGQSLSHEPGGAGEQDRHTDRRKSSRGTGLSFFIHRRFQ